MSDFPEELYWKNYPVECPILYGWQLPEGVDIDDIDDDARYMKWFHHWFPLSSFVFFGAWGIRHPHQKVLVKTGFIGYCTDSHWGNFVITEPRETSSNEYGDHEICWAMEYEPPTPE